MAASLEHVLDKIADKLITSGEFTPSTLRDNQKTIRNGTIELVRSNSEKLLLFETDINANQEDLGQASVEDMILQGILHYKLLSIHVLIMMM